MEKPNTAMLSCWVVSDGKAGMESQCLGLAEALGLSPVVKRVRMRLPWPWLAPMPLRAAPAWAISPKGDALTPPWPDLLIASGRRSVVPSLHVGKASGGRTFRIQIQDPAINPALFDLVVVPAHDRLRGPNVLVTRGALHRASPTRLEIARNHFAERLAALPHPRIAVLVGGNNDVFRLTPEIMTAFSESLAGLIRESGGSVMATPSRRTGAEAEAILRAALSGLPGEIWDGNGENPYFGYLAYADAIVATGDSVNMITEAVATGKPVHIVDLEGGSPKFTRFHAEMRAAGFIRPFAGRIEQWNYEPPDDLIRLTETVRARLAARGIALSGGHS